MEIKDWITLSLSVIAITISIITLITANYKLRNAQRTAIYNLQLQTTQNIIEHLDLLVTEIYNIRVKATSFDSGKTVKTPTQNLDHFNLLRVEYIGMIRKNSITLQNSVLYKLTNFHKYIHHKFYTPPTSFTDIDITHFRMEGEELELMNKFNKLLSDLREDFHVDKLSNETFEQLKKIK